MIVVELPDGFSTERLSKRHRRSTFDCGESAVNDWFRTKAVQSQEKLLAWTTVFLDPNSEVAGFYSLANGEVGNSDLPLSVTRGLPNRPLSVAVLAWMGVAIAHQRQGLGERLLVHALLQLVRAMDQLPFVAVMLDSRSTAAKRLYEKYEFIECLNRPNRMYLSSRDLLALVQ